MKLYHGTHNDFELHMRQCFSDSEGTASFYGAMGTVTEINLDLAGLVVVELGGNWNAGTMDEIPGNDEAVEYDADVIIFEDEDETGRISDTYRLMTAKAIAAVEIIETWEA